MAGPRSPSQCGHGRRWPSAEPSNPPASVLSPIPLACPRTPGGRPSWLPCRSPRLATRAPGEDGTPPGPTREQPRAILGAQPERAQPSLGATLPSSLGRGLRPVLPVLPHAGHRPEALAAHPWVCTCRTGGPRSSQSHLRRAPCRRSPKLTLESSALGKPSLGHEVRLRQSTRACAVVRRAGAREAERDKDGGTARRSSPSEGGQGLRGRCHRGSRATQNGGQSRMLVVTRRRGLGPQEFQKTCLWLSANTGPEGGRRPRLCSGASLFPPSRSSQSQPPAPGCRRPHAGLAPALPATAPRLGGTEASSCKGCSQGLNVRRRANPTEDRTEPARSPESLSIQAGRAPPRPSLPGCFGSRPGGTPSAAQRGPWPCSVGRAGPCWSASAPAAGVGSAKPPSPLLWGAGAGRGGMGEAPSPAEPPAQLGPGGRPWGPLGAGPWPVWPGGRLARKRTSSALRPRTWPGSRSHQSGLPGST